MSNEFEDLINQEKEDGFIDQVFEYIKIEVNENNMLEEDFIKFKQWLQGGTK